MDNKIYLFLTSIAGQIAGTIGKTICYPFDTMKAKLMVLLYFIYQLDSKN